MATNVGGLGISLTLNSASFTSGFSAANDAVSRFRNETTRSLQQTQRQVQQFSGQARAGFANFGAQIQDIAVSLASGQRPMTVFIQQGSQIASAFGPAGVAVGALGAVIGGLVVYLSQQEKAQQDAREELDKLVQSTAQYKQAIEDIAPLQQAYLQTIINLGRESERTADKQAEAAKKINESRPVFTGGRLQEPTYEDVIRDTGILQPGGGRSESENLLERLRRNRDREDRAINEYLGRNLSSAISNFETKPPYESSDEFKEAQKEAKKLNDERERAAKAAAAEKEQRDKLVASMRLQLEAARSLNKVAGEGAYAERLADIDIANQQRILKATQELTGKQLEEVKKISNEIARLERISASINTPLPRGNASDPNSLRLRGERESLDALGEYQQDQLKKELTATERFADEQARILLRPWEELVNTSSQLMAGMFEEFLNTGKLTAESLGQSFTEAINASIANLGSTLITAPLQKAVAEIATGGITNFQGFIAANQNTLQGGILGGTAGIAAGQIGGQLLGLDGKYSGLGGTAGALAGGILGSFIPGVGTMIGAGVGGLLGSLGGGLFGAENNLGNDRSSQVYNTGGRGIVYSDKSFSAGNRSITSGIIDEVQTIQEALQDLGASFGNINLRIEAGNKSGITVNGKKYATAEEALRGAIGDLLSQRNAGGLTATQETILANTKGGTAAEIGQDLAFGQTYDQLVRGGNQFDEALIALNETFKSATAEAAKLGLSTEALAAAHAREANEVNRQRDQATRSIYEQLAIAGGDNTLATQLHILETQMRELAKTAADLGVPFEVITATHQRAADELIRQRDQQIRSTYEQIAVAGGDDSLGTQLHILETRMRELAKAATDLGIPLEAVTDAHQRAARAIIEAAREQVHALDNQIVDARRNATAAIDQYLNPIKEALGPNGIGRGVFSAEASTRSGIDEFRKVLALAQGGDVQALNQIVGLGQQTISSAQAFGASGPEFAKIFTEIQRGLFSVQGVLEKEKVELARAQVDVGRETVSELVKSRLAIVDELVKSREKLAYELALLGERLVA